MAEYLKRDISILKNWSHGLIQGI